MHRPRRPGGPASRARVAALAPRALQGRARAPRASGRQRGGGPGGGNAVWPGPRRRGRGGARAGRELWVLLAVARAAAGGDRGCPAGGRPGFLRSAETFCGCPSGTRHHSAIYPFRLQCACTFAVLLPPTTRSSWGPDWVCCKQVDNPPPREEDGTQLNDAEAAPAPGKRKRGKQQALGRAAKRVKLAEGEPQSQSGRHEAAWPALVQGAAQLVAAMKSLGAHAPPPSCTPDSNASASDVRWARPSHAHSTYQVEVCLTL